MSTAQAALLRHIHQLAGTGNVDPLSDRELLRRFAAKRDEAAFAALVRRHGPMVRSVCRRTLHRPQDVEDAFQATFLVLLRKAAGHPWRESIGGWLHGVAVRVALRIRAEAARCPADTRGTGERAVADPLEQLTARELFAAFDEELARLPASYREPLVLCYLEGKTREEAARQLGWSLSTVRRRLERGRNVLQGRLTRRGVVLPAALGAVLLSHNAASAGIPMPALNDAISARAVALADAVGKAALLTPIKTMSAMLVALSILVAGAGLAVWHVSAKSPEAPPTEQSPRAEAKPKDETAARTDLYGDPLPPGVLLRLGTVRFRHHNFLANLAYSPDGKILAAGGYVGTILLYDAATGRKLHELRARASDFPAFAFAPDGKTLVCVGAKTVQVWDVATGKEQRRFATEVSDVFEVRYGHHITVPPLFSPDGKKLAAAAPDHSVRIWDMKSGKELVKLRGHRNQVRCLAFSPDGKTLVSASGDVVTAGSVREWSMATGKELPKISLHRDQAPGQPNPLCFSPDGKTLVFAAPETLRRKGFPNRLDWNVVSLFDVETGKVCRRLEPQEGRFKAAAFSPDGKVLATMNAVPTIVGNHASDAANRIRVWDAATGKQLFDFPAYAEYIVQGPCHLAFTPDGKKLAAAATATSLHVWDLSRGREYLEKPAAHHDRIVCLAYSPDGRTLATTGSDHTIALWDAATGRQRLRLRGHEGEVASLAFSPDGKRLASASRFNDQSVRLWDTARGKELRRSIVPSMRLGGGASLGVATSVAFAAGGKILAAGGTDRKIRLWDVASGKELLNHAVRGLPVPSRGGPNDPFPWKEYVNHVAFSPDGGVMALSIYQTIHVVDVAAGQRLFQFERGSGNLALLALSPDGKTILCGGRGNSFRLVECASGKDLHKVDLAETYSIEALAFAHDGRTVAVGTGDIDGAILLFDVPIGRQILRLRGHHSRINSLAFSPDGTKLASGQQDTTALIWDISASRRKLSVTELTPRDLDRLWADLKDTDAPKAHAALWSLVAVPDKAVPYLKDLLHPVPRVSPDRLRRLIADLDAEDFAGREAAARELAKLGIEAAPALRQALAAKPSLEMRRRVEALLSGLACQTEMTPEAQRQLRAIQVLEQIGSPEARGVLETLAQGAPAAPATRDAKAALARFTSR